MILELTKRIRSKVVQVIRESASSKTSSSHFVQKKEICKVSDSKELLEAFSILFTKRGRGTVLEEQHLNYYCKILGVAIEGENARPIEMGNNDEKIKQEIFNQIKIRLIKEERDDDFAFLNFLMSSNRDNIKLRGASVLKWGKSLFFHDNVNYTFGLDNCFFIAAIGDNKSVLAHIPTPAEIYFWPKANLIDHFFEMLDRIESKDLSFYVVLNPHGKLLHVLDQKITERFSNAKLYIHEKNPSLIYQIKTLRNGNKLTFQYQSNPKSIRGNKYGSGYYMIPYFRYKDIEFQLLS